MLFMSYRIGCFSTSLISHPELIFSISNFLCNRIDVIDKCRLRKISNTHTQLFNSFVWDNLDEPISEETRSFARELVPFTVL